MKTINLITSEDQYIQLAGELQELLPESWETNQVENSIQIQLDMAAKRPLEDATYALTYANQKVDEARATLAPLVKNFNGSEVADQKMQRATSWLRAMEGQLEFIERRVGTQDDLDAAKAAYKSFFGKAWVPYSSSKNVAAKMKETAALLEAKEALGIK